MVRSANYNTGKSGSVGTTKVVRCSAAGGPWLGGHVSPGRALRTPALSSIVSYCEGYYMLVRVCSTGDGVQSLALARQTLPLSCTHRPGQNLN